MDGTKVTIPRDPSWKTEFLGQYLTLKSDPMIVLLLVIRCTLANGYVLMAHDHGHTTFQPSHVLG